MGLHWFRRAGWFYRPDSIIGVTACLAAFALCVNVFVAIDRHSNSNTDTLYGVFPYFAGLFLLLDWRARNTAADAGARQ